MAFQDPIFETRRQQLYGTATKNGVNNSKAPTNTPTQTQGFTNPQLEARRVQIYNTPAKKVSNQPVTISKPQPKKEPTLLEKAQAFIAKIPPIQQIPDAVYKNVKSLDYDRIKAGFEASTKATPGTLKVAGGVIAEGWAKQQKFMNQFYGILPKELEPFFGNQLTKPVLNKVADVVMEKAPQVREKGIQERNKAIEPYAKLGPAKGNTQTIAEALVFNLPQMALSTGLTVATGLATKNPALATAVGLSTSYGLGASEVYGEARSNGLTDKQSMPYAMAGGAIIGTIDFLPLNRLLRKTGAAEQVEKTIIKKIAQGVVSAGTQSGFEGITEAAQELVGNAIRSTYSENKDLFEGVGLSAVVGALFGGATDVTLSTGLNLVGKGKSVDQAIETVDKKIEEILDTPSKKRTPEEQLLVNELLTTQVSPDEAIDIVTENKLESTPEGKEIMKAVVEAKQSNKEIKIVSNEDRDIESIEIVNPNERTTITAETAQPKIKVRTQVQIKKEVADGTVTAEEYLGTGKAKRQIISTKESKAIKDNLISQIQEFAAMSETPEQYTKITKEAVDDAITKAKNDKVVLSAIRAALSDEMIRISGASKSDNYKAQYAQIQIAMKDEFIGKSLEYMEEKKVEIDEKLKTAREVPAVIEKRKVITLKSKSQKTTSSKETPTGEGKTKNSRLFERVRETLGADFENENRTYNELSLDAQAEKVAALIETDPEKAARIARGLEEPLSGTTQNATAMGIFEVALGQEDYTTAAELLTNTSLRSTRLGQEIVSLRGDFAGNENLNAVKQIINARLDQVSKRYKDVIKGLTVTEDAPTIKKVDALVKHETKKLKKEMTKQQAQIQDAQAIINALTCK